MICEHPSLTISSGTGADSGPASEDEPSGSVAARVRTFCATWKAGAGFLADCAVTLAEGLNSASNNYAATEDAIRGAVNSVKSDLG